MRDRFRTQLGPPDEDGGQDDGSTEIPGEFVVAGCDPAPILDPAKGPFDDVAGFVSIFVELGGCSCASGSDGSPAWCRAWLESCGTGRRRRRCRPGGSRGAATAPAPPWRAGC